MIDALFLALGQLSDRRILSLLLKIFLITLFLLGILGVGLYYLLIWLFSLSTWNDGGFAAATAAALIAIIASILLFRIVAIFVLNIFSDDIVDAVESKHYPARAETAKPPNYLVGLKMGLRSAFRAIGYNLLAAPVYVLLIVTGIGTAIAFFAVNAILIGRDLQDMVASRHIGNAKQIGEEWQIGKARRFGLGLITALLLAIPFINFLAPILGAAMATHLVHRKRDLGEV
ncbi:hypothetical protein MNBD_ALPHA04-249 [hydrothermal vent metagenome]|uniref:CysZ-like protein n=1 Tax=hydrothermal vent metagenome TaxID=652676 RepID=A0A3B0R4W1_9ZZZZ